MLCHIQPIFSFSILLYNRIYFSLSLSLSLSYMSHEFLFESGFKYMNCITIRQLYIEKREVVSFYYSAKIFLTSCTTVSSGTGAPSETKNRSLWERLHLLYCITGRIMCDICATWLNYGYRYLRPSYAPWAKSEIFLERKTRC